MKVPISFILIIFLPLLTKTCGHLHEMEASLDHAEKLLWEQPHEVVRVLEGMDTDLLSTANRYRHLLLYAQASYRTGKKLDNDTLLRTLETYYTQVSLQPSTYLSAVHFLYGLYWMDKADDTLSIHQFKQAESFLSSDNQKLRSAIHSNIGYLYLRQGWTDKSLYHYGISAHINRDLKRWDWLANDLNSIYPVLYLTDRPSSDTIRKELISLSVRCSDSIRQQIYLNLGWSCFQSGHYREAEHYAHQGISLPYRTVRTKLDILLSRIHDANGDSILSDSLCQSALLTAHYHERLVLHRYMIERLKHRHQDDSAHHHLEEYIHLRDSVEKIRELEKFAEITFRYDLTRLERKAWYNSSLLFFIIGILLLFITLSIHFHGNDYERHLTHLSCKLLRIKNLYIETRSIQNDIEYKYWLSKRLLYQYREQDKRKMHFYRSMYHRIKAELKRLALIYKVSYQEERLSDDDIRSFGLYLRMQQKGYVMHIKSELSALLHWTDLMHGHFGTHLLHLYPRLTPTQQAICCLLKCGYSTDEIRDILDIKEESMRRYLVRMYPLFKVSDRKELFNVLNRL